MKNAADIGLTVVDAVVGVSTGIVPEHGGYSAMTLTECKFFTTARGAIAWMAKRGYNANGTKKGGI